MGREPRQRQQAAAAARNAPAPVSQSTSILDMPNDQFQGALRELASQGLPQDRIDDLMRQYRSANSPLAPINEAAASARQEADAGGRKSIVGGMFTKDAGATGMDAVRSMRPSLTAGLLGALSGGGQAVDAPMAAAQGLIPQGDMALEALGTAGAAMTGGGAAAGRGVLDYDPNTARIFAGPRAKTADLGAMTRAQEMAARGVSRDDIWRDTGWFAGTDGNWRFEIDDSGATFNPSVREGWGVGNSARSLVDEMAAADDLASAGKPDALIERVTGMRRTDGGWQDTRPPASVPLTHTGLADAYNFDGLAVRDQPALTAAGYDGAFDGGFNSASPSAAGRVDYSSASKDPRSTILHELQHAVDKQEGFQPGGSVEGAGSIDNYRRLASEVGARNTQARRDFTPSNRAETPPWLTQDTPDASQILANADTSGGLLATAASDALTPSQQMARRILDMRAAGRARDVTDDMMAQADPQYMFNNTPLPMDAASRSARAQAAGFGDDMYHGSTHSFDNFGGGRTRNTEGHFGAGDYLTSSADDASMNYAGEGPDLTQRITMRAEQLADEMGVDYDDPAALAAARNELSGGTDGLVYPVRYRANKEFDISDDGDTFLSYDQPQMDPADYLDEAGGDMDLAQELAMDDSYNFEPEGDLVNFMDSIRWDGRVSDNEGLLSALQENAYDGGLLGRQVDDVMRNTEWWAEDDMGRLVNNEVYRNSLQDAGFDAIRHNGDIFPGMDIEPGTTHTIINNPANIRSQFARFDPEFAHLSNLSAANVSPTAGSLATISADDEEQRKRDIVQRLMPSAQNIIRRQ